jgi:hypothetical protein
MRIFLLSEGVTDVGRIDPDGSFRTESTLQHLLRKLIHEVAPDREVEFFSKRGPRLFPKKERIGRSQHGFANRLIGVLGLKEGREADAIVMVVDRDGKRNKDRIVELNKGREAVREAKKPCAVGVAIEMIEAWLLADEKALRTALEDPSIQRQPDPEDLDSRDKESEKYPKRKLARLMEQSLGREIARSEFPDLYGKIAEAATIHFLQERCPDGFRPFAEQVRELASAVEDNDE